MAGFFRIYNRFRVEHFFRASRDGLPATKNPASSVWFHLPGYQKNLIREYYSKISRKSHFRIPMIESWKMFRWFCPENGIIFKKNNCLREPENKF